MKRILVFAVIICMALLLCVNAQDKWVSPPAMNDKIGMENPETKVPIPEPKPAPKVVEPVKPITYLKVTLIDGINDKVFELKNCIVQIKGELNMCDNIFPYQKTFVNGNDYEITIWIKLKK